MLTLTRHRELLGTPATNGGAVIDVIIDGAGPAIVLLPSSLRDSEDFDNLAQGIASNGFQVLRPQPRGMGHSSPPPPDMTLATLASDVALTIERLAAGPAVVVGHAFGHWIARVLDLHHPQCVRGVVALAASAKAFPPGLVEALALASNPGQPEEVRLSALAKSMFASGNDARPWLRGWHPHLRPAYRNAGLQPPKDVWFPVANAPILDLQGELDPWRPAASRFELKDILGDKVTVQVIANASHAITHEQPEAVTEAIVNWVHGLTGT